MSRASILTLYSLKVYGDECPGAAHLCRDVLEVEGTPEFRFYRGGNLLHIMHGADKNKLETSVQSLLREGEFGARSHLPETPRDTKSPYGRTHQTDFALKKRHERDATLRLLVFH